MGYREHVCIDDTLLYAIGVIVEIVLYCAVVDFILACGSCDSHQSFCEMNDSRSNQVNFPV